MSSHLSPASDAAQRGNKGATTIGLRDPAWKVQDRDLICPSATDGSTVPSLKASLRSLKVLASAHHAGADVSVAQRMAPTPHELAAGRARIDHALLDAMPTAKHPTARA